MFHLNSDERYDMKGEGNGRQWKILLDHVFHVPAARSMNYWWPKKLTVVTCPRWGKSESDFATP